MEKLRNFSALVKWNDGSIEEISEDFSSSVEFESWMNFYVGSLGVWS